MLSSERVLFIDLRVQFAIYMISGLNLFNFPIFKTFFFSHKKDKKVVSGTDTIELHILP